VQTIPSALQAKLDGGVTTLCRCWHVARRDGVIQGFTDHDEDVVLDTLTCRAGAGLSGSEATARLGLAVAGSEIAGALADEALSEADLAAGRYDAASVDIFLVDWSEPSLHVRLGSYMLGEVRREGGAFAAELRSLADRLNAESGRRYTAACSADLGDARCAVDLSADAFRGSGSIAALRGTSSFAATGLGDYADGWFTAGRLAWSTGANEGLAVEVKSHRMVGDEVVIDLWQLMPEPLSEDDTFTVTAGCDKRFATCRDRFDNALNFRGFPHIPGNDFVTRYAVAGEPGNKGKSLQS
jgi:uncharacterized phage protein (TIGR02218 family)